MFSKWEGSWGCRGGLGFRVKGLGVWRLRVKGLGVKGLGFRGIMGFLMRGNTGSNA